MKASWLACNYFAFTNNLSEAATKQLLDLIAIHCSETDQCAKSTFQLRKRLNPFDDVEMHMYCSECMKELSDTKKCIDCNCRRKDRLFSTSVYFHFISICAPCFQVGSIDTSF